MQHPRLGPRPLPLHLSTALMTWASSESAWQLWKRASPNSKPGFARADGLADLLQEIAASDPIRFEAALHREIGRRLDRLADAGDVRDRGGRSDRHRIGIAQAVPANSVADGSPIEATAAVHLEEPASFAGE